MNWKSCPVELVEQRVPMANLMNPKLPPVGVVHIGQFNIQPKLPLVGYYNQKEGFYDLNTDCAKFRLHPAQFANLPLDVQRVIGDPKGQKLKLYATIQNNQYILEKTLDTDHPRRLNLHTHGFVHEHYEAFKDETHRVEMGVYSPMNVLPKHSQDGISFEEMKPLPVQIHPVDGSIAFSPNNAHIEIGDPVVNPITSFWSVVKDVDRIVIVHHLLLNTQSEANLLLDPFYDEPTIGRAIQKMKEKVLDNQQLLERIGTAFKVHARDAFAQFEALPENIRNGIFRKTWQMQWVDKDFQGNPPHADFGKVSFYASDALAKTYQCRGIDRERIIHKFAEELKGFRDQAIERFERSFTPIAELEIGSDEESEKRQLLLPIAEKFAEGKGQEAFEAFHGLPDAFKRGVFQYVWECKGCPRDFPGDFGEAVFYGRLPASDIRNCSDEQRSHFIQYFIHSL